MARGIRAKADKLASKSHDPKLRDLRWWRHDKPHDAIWDHWNRIGSRTRGRRSQDLYFACLYDDSELAQSVQGLGAIGEFTPQTLATNIVRRQVDTFVAKIAKNRPVPMGLTTGGNYSQQRRAKAISKFFEGVLDEVEFWPTRTLRLRDGAIFGSGLALNYRRGRKMIHDRIYAPEIRVDPRDAIYGKPRMLFLGRFIDKLVACERWPDKAEQILEADADFGDGSWAVGYDETSNLLAVVEAWHLPSGEGASDGAHAVACSNATLEIDEYVRDYFPLSKFDFSPPVFGWWGEGLVKQLAGLQYEVNSVGLRLQERHYLMGTYVAVSAESPIEWEQIDNGSMTELRYEGGTPPAFLNPPATHGDLFNWFEMLRTRMPGEITGISGLSSRSEKPAGLDSGKALRTYHDIDTENLTPQGRADEKDVIDTCWQLFDLAEEIHAEEPAKGKRAEPYRVRIESRKHGKSVLEDLSWKDVRLDREKFVLRVFPTSFLSSTPEDRWSQVQEMIKGGFLSQDEAMVLLDFPDLERVMTLRGAARRNIERLLEKLLEADDPDAVYVYPEPAMNLELCQALAIMTYLDAKLDGAPEANLQAVLQFALDAKAELAKAMAPEKDGPPPPPDAAELMGEPPPPEMMPPGAEALYAPPAEAPLPAGAVAPEVMPALPPGVPTA